MQHSLTEAELRALIRLWGDYLTKNAPTIAGHDLVQCARRLLTIAQDLSDQAAALAKDRNSGIS